MMIHKVTRFKTLDKEFHSLQQAITYREQRVEDFISKLQGFKEFPKKHALIFMDELLATRKELVNLLNYSDWVENEDQDDEL